MPANRISRHLISNRISGAMAGCCVAVSLASVSAVPASQPWQLQVYEAAALAARKQVANRRRYELSTESSYRWN